MSDKLMDTEPGGETPQYESIQTVTNPNAKQGGQMGEPESEAPSSMKTTAQMAEGGASGAKGDKSEQNVLKGGVGGHTATSGGSGHADEGFGGSKNESGFEGTTADKSRAPEGYGKGQDMDKTIGA